MQIFFPLLLLLFFIAVLFCFTLPCIFFLNKTGSIFSFWEKIIVGTVVGFTGFTIASYVLFLLKINMLLIPAVIVLDFLSIKQILSKHISIKLYPTKQLIILFLIFTIGIISQLLVIAPSGSFSSGGDLIFWSAHGHDGFWHLALVGEMNKGFPLQNPVFGGERVVNYHFFSDITIANFSSYLHFPALDLYFRLFPILFSLLLGTTAFILGKKVGNSFVAGIGAVFFTYFAGSFGYMVTYLQSKTIGGETLFWATQIQSSIGNPPQIISSIIVLTFVYLTIYYLATKNKVLLLFLIILSGSLAVFKVYAAVVVLASLAIISIWQIIRERKTDLLKIFIPSTALSLILYLPNTTNSSSFLIFEPWWFIRTMIVAGDKLNLLDWELRRQTYIAEGNWKRVLQLEGTGFIIFFLGNLGMRLLGFWEALRLFKKIKSDYTAQLFILIMSISLVLPLLFLQKGVASNTIQFLQYLLLLMGILAGVTLSVILGKIRFILAKIILIILLIILTIPTQVGLIHGFYKNPPIAKVTKAELAALEMLKNQPGNGLVITPSYDNNFRMSEPTQPIWAWSDTGYVAALSHKRTYLSDMEQVDIMGYNYKKRLKTQQDLFSTNDPKLFVNILKENNIQYIYFPKKRSPQTDLSKTYLLQIFDSSEVEIWQVI